MRILLDENIPVDLATELVGHDVETVVGLGWAGTANGKLLERASGRCDIFVTIDRNIQHQQNVSRFPFGLLVLRAPSNRMGDLIPLVPTILGALAVLAPGQLRHVGA